MITGNVTGPLQRVQKNFTQAFRGQVMFIEDIYLSYLTLTYIHNY